MSSNIKKILRKKRGGGCRITEEENLGGRYALLGKLGKVSGDV